MSQTLAKHGAVYNRLVCEFCGLSTDIKPLVNFSASANDVVYIENGSTFYEMDTGKKYIYDTSTHSWCNV